MFQNHKGYISAGRNAIALTNYKSPEPIAQNSTTLSYNSDGLSLPHDNPSSKISKSHEDTSANSPGESTSECSLTFPPMLPPLNSFKNKLDNFESFVSLLKWEKYLLTPHKPKLSAIKALVSPAFRMYPPTTQDIGPEPSFSPSNNKTIDDHLLPFDETAEWFSPTKPFHEDYIIDEQSAEDEPNGHNFAANACAQKFQSEKVNNWDRRVLFPVPDVPLRPSY